jgi:hypothetical protein
MDVFPWIATEPHYLETYTPEVTSAYVQSRLEAVAMVMREGLEDPLDDMGLVQQQLEQISVIMRMDYAKTCSLLISLFEQSAQSFQELVRSPIATTVDLAIQEGLLGFKNFQFNWDIVWITHAFLCRSINVASLHNRCCHWRSRVLHFEWWTWFDGWRISLPVCWFCFQT